MCRHLAYVGEPVRPGELLVEPPHGLVRQSWAPRRQRSGTVNVDGFGIGWYADGSAEPARHRGAGPVWADETFADLARVIRTPALLAAVRSATPGMPPGTDSAAPLRRDRWLFSHNGRLDGWPAAAQPLAAGLGPGRLLHLEGRTDSALLWACTLSRLERGYALGRAVAEVVTSTEALLTGRLNLLVTDGIRIAGSACGDSLVWRLLPDGSRPRGVVVASEPYDDHPGWCDVPDHHVICADAHGVQVTPL